MKVLFTVCFLLLGTLFHAIAVDNGPALHLSRGQAQLFVDDFLIQSQSGVKRTLHSPKKDHDGNIPVLALEDEYGSTPATLEANGTIVYDTRLKKYVMFALSFCSGIPGEGRVRLYRFTSPDAMHWIKGDNGKPEQVTFDMIDQASGRKAAGFDLFSCYYDARDAVYPYKGWLYYWNWEDLEGVYYVRSKDGKTWERGARVMPFMSREIQQDGRTLRGPADVTIFYRDEIADQFLASIKFYSPQPVGPNNYLRSRAYAFVKRLDEPFDLSRLQRVEFVPPAAEADGEMPTDEYYASTAWRYESVWLGGLKVWHKEGNYPHSSAGCAFLKFAVSRDGLNWDKVPFENAEGQREVFIANGKEGGNDGRNDGGYMTELSQGPLRLGDELIYYYGSSSWGKNHPGNVRVTGGGIFRARLRPDGFVSVDSGVLTTKPFLCQGRELRVNSSGALSVAMLDANGKTLGTAKLTGDSLRQTVAFKGNSFAKLSRGKPVRLQFTIENGRLYSFTID